MKAPETVKQLFARLDDRLSTFESKRHHTDFSDELVPIRENTGYTFIIFKITKVFNEYDPVEVNELAHYYEERATIILRNLKPISKRYVQLDNDKIVYDKISEEDQKWILENWQNELATYIEQLQMIQRITAKRIEASKEIQQLSKSTQKQGSPSESQSIQINLPENFTVTQLNKRFDPQLSVNQAALFLYYLREHAVLPPYSDSSIGKLAEAFFVRNQKNVTKGLTDIYTIKSNEGELSSLKKMLQKLIKEIDNDLKEAH